MTIHLARFDKKAWSIAAVTLLVLAGLLLLFSWRTAQASGPDTGRLITIHDKQLEEVLISKKTTVSEVLKQARINLKPDDNVVPAASSHLSAPAYHINIYRAQPVLVIDGNTRQTIMTPYQTPKQIAASAHRPLQSEDTTKLTQSDNVLNSNGSNLQLTIHRATEFTLILYGKAIDARTQAATVGEMLKDKNITLAPKDTVSVPQTTPITAGLTVQIWRNGTQTVNEEQPIAFAVQQIQDADQPVGYKVIKTPGVLGKKNVTFEVNMQNGQEISRKVIQEVVTLQPQQQVEIVGAKPSFSGSFADALARLRGCEAGGSYNRNSGNGFYGAYQYDISTWGGYGGYTRASDAPPSVQDQKTWETYQRRGWHPWPTCGASLPDTYR